MPAGACAGDGVGVGDGVGDGVGTAVGEAVDLVGVGVGATGGGVLETGADAGAEVVGLALGVGAVGVRAVTDGTVPLLVTVGTGADDHPAGGAVAARRVAAAGRRGAGGALSPACAADDVTGLPVAMTCGSVARVPADGVPGGSSARGSAEGAAPPPAATPTAARQETTSSTATMASQGGRPLPRRALRANATAPHRPLYREHYATLDETASHVAGQVTRYVTDCSPTGHRPGARLPACGVRKVILGPEP
jgi:hypothetical protein